MAVHVVICGAGFGGLELMTVLSETLGDRAEITLIDQSDHFVFGFSKLDVMYGRTTADAVKVPYSRITRPGVRFRRETIRALDPVSRRVTTDAGTYDADFLVVALGADYDVSATPGLAEGGNEFYSMAGAQRLRELLPGFSKGHAIVGVTSTPFKCPPAPSEAALLLHDHLLQRGVRDACEISIIMPFGAPIPPSPAASQGLMSAFGERGIKFLGNRLVRHIDPARRTVILGDGPEIAYDLFLGVPKHRVPDVVEASGMTEDGWVPVNPHNLKTRFDRVYAIGDVTSVGTAKAGVFAEGAGRVAAASIITEIEGQGDPDPYKGDGSCYIEFGAGEVGRVYVDFLSGPSPKGEFAGASAAIVAEKEEFGASRRRRWFA